jgi:GNAT superfamily N-acetyltransferase
LGTGTFEGHPGGSLPSSDSDTCPDDVEISKLLGVVVAELEELELEQATSPMVPATTATAPATQAEDRQYDQALRTVIVHTMGSHRGPTHHPAWVAEPRPLLKSETRRAWRGSVWGMTTSPVVRRILPDEVARYRELRLRALRDSPAAFTATWDDESRMALGAWAARVEASVTGASVIVVADTGEELVGLAGGVPWQGRARVVSVWVAPAWRGRGVARCLIEAVCEWAIGAGYREAQIETATTNPGPQALYQRLGFASVDEPPPPDCGAVLVRAL